MLGFRNAAVSAATEGQRNAGRTLTSGRAHTCQRAVVVDLAKALLPVYRCMSATVMESPPRRSRQRRNPRSP